uniref:Uncharacterized protein n=1 Tax=Oryza rufipogon TaxID=4529 RepID=A0A0E0QG23_ORYRU
MNRCFEKKKKQPRCELDLILHRSPPDLRRGRRFPTSNGEQPALDPAGVVSATAAGNFSSGQIDGALAAGFRWGQVGSTLLHRLPKGTHPDRIQRKDPKCGHRLGVYPLPRHDEFFTLQVYDSKDLAGTSNIFSRLSEDVITKVAKQQDQIMSPNKFGAKFVMGTWYRVYT